MVTPLFDGWWPGDIPWLFTLIPPMYRYYHVADGRRVTAGIDEMVRDGIKREYARQLYAEMVDPEWPRGLEDEDQEPW